MLRNILIGFTITIAIYTLYTISQYGLGLFAVFFGNVLTGDWNGQFNLDFALYLALSALWIAWRSGFSGPSLVAAAICGVMGMLVFAPYVLVQWRASKGDMRRLLLGVHAGGAQPTL